MKRPYAEAYPSAIRKKKKKEKKQQVIINMLHPNISPFIECLVPKQIPQSREKKRNVIVNHESIVT
jgi:hypothetical protein